MALYKGQNKGKLTCKKPWFSQRRAKSILQPAFITFYYSLNSKKTVLGSKRGDEGGQCKSQRKEKRVIVYIVSVDLKRGLK